MRLVKERLMAFDRFAGGVAIAVAIGGVAYSIVFVVAERTQSRPAMTASWLLLLVGGILSTAVLVALYRRLREVDPGFALWGTLVWLGGAIGSIVHGGYDLALDTEGLIGIGLPNAIDPRGLATFGLTGLGILVLSPLVRRSGDLPSGLGWLGTAFGILLILTYLGRLLIVDPSNPVLLAVAAVAGVIVHPWWYVWLGRSLRRG